MKTQKTYKIKLYNPTNKKENLLKQTAREWNNCVRFYLKEDNNLYDRSKEKWAGLSTGLIQTARDKADEIKCSSESENYSKNKPIVFDERTLCFKEEDGNVYAGISNVGKRFYCPIQIASEHLKILKNRNFDYQKVLLKKEENDWYLHITISKNSKIPDESEFDHYIGIDIGINNFAVVSVWDNEGNHCESKFFNDGRMEEKRDRYHKLRKSYGKNKLLDKIKETKGKERRYIEDRLHKISSKIIEIANKYNNVCLVMEKLKGVRNNKYNKEMNKRLNRWPFNKFQKMLQYKAHWNQIAYRKVNPRGTSSYCSDCTCTLRIESSCHVQCITCDKIWHRDWIASKNIVRRLWFYMNHNSSHSESGSELSHDNHETQFSSHLRVFVA